jgi:hypothetical protein
LPRRRPSQPTATTICTALRAAYASMADDTLMIRKKRAEKRAKMMEGKS